MLVDVGLGKHLYRLRNRATTGVRRRDPASSWDLSRVLWGEHIPATGCMAEVQMQQLDPALHMKSQLEFRMLSHAKSYCNIQNKVDEG